MMFVSYGWMGSLNLNIKKEEYVYTYVCIYVLLVQQNRYCGNEECFSGLTKYICIFERALSMWQVVCRECYTRTIRNASLL